MCVCACVCACICVYVCVCVCVCMCVCDPIMHNLTIGINVLTKSFFGYIKKSTNDLSCKLKFEINGSLYLYTFKAANFLAYTC